MCIPLRTPPMVLYQKEQRHSVQMESTVLVSLEAALAVLTVVFLSGYPEGVSEKTNPLGVTQRG